ncbi:MAG: DUF6049 family protein [Mycobacteriaceae bacterium]
MMIPLPNNALRNIVGLVTLILMLVFLGSYSGKAYPAPRQTEPKLLKIEISSVTPNYVITTSDPLVTVFGSISNIGDRSISEVSIRLQRAPVITKSEGLRTVLQQDESEFSIAGNFVDIAKKIDMGQKIPFTISLPLRSISDPSLRIERPGIYPLLVNVNGIPEYSGENRLDEARFLLPVLGLPQQPETTDTDALTSAIAPATSNPVDITVLWPVADRPRLAAGIPGKGTVRLTDDELATSLATGGRLDRILSAAEFVVLPGVDLDQQLTKSLCLAVDPDLLLTVEAMSNGYVISDNPADPQSTTHPGTGQIVAGTWLERLRQLASKLCTAPMPYAQANLDALSKIEDPGLTTFAINNSGNILDRILGYPSQRGTIISTTEALTEDSLSLLSTQTPITTFVPANTVTGGQPSTGLAAKNLALTTFSTDSSAALAAVGNSPQTPSYTAPELRYDLERDSPTARLQDALGAISWSALNPETSSRTEVLVPPAQWDISTDEAAQILSTVATLIRSGLAQPRPLSTLILQSQTSNTSVNLTTDTPSNSTEVSTDLRNLVQEQISLLWRLTESFTEDTQSGLTPFGYTEPLVADLLRILSTTNNNPQITAASTTALTTTLNTMIAGVSVLNPGGSYTLASEQSPLLLVVRNDLPIPIRIRLKIDVPPGMTVADIGERVVPSNGQVPLTIPTDAQYTRQVAVNVSLTTPTGIELGSPVQISVRSNAYGKPLFISVLVAGALLLLLAGRRLWHRFRGEPDPADLDRDLSFTRWKTS